jgi:hypothetical protein
MTERALNQQRWKRVGPAIMDCQECANALDKSELAIWSGVGTGTEIDLSIPGSIAYRTLPRPRFWSFRKNVE